MPVAYNLCVCVLILTCVHWFEQEVRGQLVSLRQYMRTCRQAMHINQMFDEAGPWTSNMESFSLNDFLEVCCGCVDWQWEGRGRGTSQLSLSEFIFQTARLQCNGFFVFNFHLLSPHSTPFRHFYLHWIMHQRSFT